MNRRIVRLLPLGLPLGMTGCAAVAWLAAVTAPPNTIPPHYQLPQGSTVLVLVDDPQQRATRTPAKSELIRALNKQLVEHDVAKKTIALKRIMQTAAVTPNFNHLRAVDIGRKLEADFVIHVSITEFSLKDDPIGHIWEGRLATNVKVYDVEEGRVWPTDRPDGYPVEPADHPTTENFASDFGNRLAVKLAREMADNISKLFYEHPGQEHHELPTEYSQDNY
ncbi:MAG: hypothetical protein GVY16_06940 [Planctomycetes bacterium]|jgi:hypothetical protein|nr:hypothetical protein [Phycisphaerae bacterium]NBB95462.1 hypothetical protein [Planctomycetota bacterium]